MTSSEITTAIPSHFAFGFEWLRDLGTAKTSLLLRLMIPEFTFFFFFLFLYKLFTLYFFCVFCPLPLPRLVDSECTTRSGNPILVNSKAGVDGSSRCEEVNRLSLGPLRSSPAWMTRLKRTQELSAEPTSRRALSRHRLGSPLQLRFSAQSWPSAT